MELEEPDIIKEFEIIFEKEKNAADDWETDKVVKLNGKCSRDAFVS